MFRGFYGPEGGDPDVCQGGLCSRGDCAPGSCVPGSCAPRSCASKEVGFPGGLCSKGGCVLVVHQKIKTSSNVAILFGMP